MDTHERLHPADLTALLDSARPNVLRAHDLRRQSERLLEHAEGLRVQLDARVDSHSHLSAAVRDDEEHADGELATGQ